MRITKKFSGVGSIGKCVFHPRDPPNPDKAARAKREIEALEVRALAAAIRSCLING